MILWLVGAVNFVLLTASVVANPTPEAPGTWEVVMVLGSVAATSVILWRLATRPFVVEDFFRRLLLNLLTAFALPVIISLAVASVRGVPLMLSLRATVPYVVFVPIGLVGLVVPGRDHLKWLIRALWIVGSAHAMYLVGLYLIQTTDLFDARTVWLSRITFLDPRTTLPLFLAPGILPLALLGTRRGRLVKLASFGLVAISVLAALSTQTRSQILALVAGGGSFAILYTTRKARLASLGWSVGFARGALIGLLGVVVVGGLVVAIPPTRALASALALRSQFDLDNGRIDEEWVPAFTAVVDDGVPGLLAGIGAGESFITASGEERTYVHNLLLYTLVYYGLPGVLLLVLLYGCAGVGLVRRGLATGDTRYLALAALLIAMFVYAQFFAVHKLLSYNLMLMLILQVLLRPRAADGPLPSLGRKA